MALPNFIDLDHTASDMSFDVDALRFYQLSAQLSGQGLAHSHAQRIDTLANVGAAPTR